MAMLPIKTNFKGPLMQERDNSKEDIVDETIRAFKANVLFRNYEIKGGGDRVMVYLTLYITQCINAIRPTMGREDARNAMLQLAIQTFTVPGDAAFPLAGFFKAPANRGEADQVKQMLQQLRQECGSRLVDAVYQHNAAAPSKGWMGFTKRKFLNKTMA